MITCIYEEFLEILEISASFHPRAPFGVLGSRGSFFDLFLVSRTHVICLMDPFGVHGSPEVIFLELRTVETFVKCLTGPRAPEEYPGVPEGSMVCSVLM